MKDLIILSMINPIIMFNVELLKDLIPDEEWMWYVVVYSLIIFNIWKLVCLFIYFMWATSLSNVICSRLYLIRPRDFIIRPLLLVLCPLGYVPLDYWDIIKYWFKSLFHELLSIVFPSSIRVAIYSFSLFYN